VWILHEGLLATYLSVTTARRTGFFIIVCHLAFVWTFMRAAGNLLIGYNCAADRFFHHGCHLAFVRDFYEGSLATYLSVTTARRTGFFIIVCHLTSCGSLCELACNLLVGYNCAADRLLHHRVSPRFVVLCSSCLHITTVEIVMQAEQPFKAVL
jgi:hypothetical protein